MSEPVHIPEVLESDENLPPDLQRLRAFASLLDEAVRIPGVNRRVGLDAALGLIPGVGDVITAVMSAWIISGALRHRVPTPKVLRMIWYVIVDLLFGAIPLAGDVLDMLFKQNVRNMKILMQHRNRRLPPRRTSEIAASVTLIVILLVGVALLVLVGTVGAIIWIAAQRN
ncbi:MAG TPA: DUF4112 domain-containing protein [Thermoanaerobaculia bacterium]|nr:DUF4112 domain-containing protein [Thermoanaerobaculia bacterium]